MTHSTPATLEALQVSETKEREEEALDRLERTAGPQARQMLEQFLKQVKEVEAKYLQEESTD